MPSSKAEPEGGFGIYVHWPFCAAKCPYCDFNSHVRGAVDQALWRRAFETEIATVAQRIDRGRVQSIFFGGGTPSLMEPATVDAVLSSISKHYEVDPEVEISLEANPTSVEAERFAGFAAAGVNRVSIGVQALEDAALRRLGRLHTVGEALAALDVARATFSRVSFDLIYARQAQSYADWQDELGRALALGPDHLSLYQLTIEPGTAFGALHAKGALRDLPPDDLAADLYALTQQMTGAAGVQAYEISNHAAPGAQCRHNLIYWRGGDYVGIGPGAHGRVHLDGRRVATETAKLPEAWLERVAAGGHGQTVEDAISAEQDAVERLLMGLRLHEGVDLRRLAPLSLDQTVMGDMVAEGFVERLGHRIAATARGRMVLNAILRRLLT